MASDLRVRQFDRLRAERIHVLPLDQHPHEEVPVRQRDQVLRREVVAELLTERASVARAPKGVRRRRDRNPRRASRSIRQRTPP